MRSSASRSNFVTSTNLPRAQMLDAVGRAHEHLERPADAHLDLRLRHGEAGRREPALDMVGRTPGLEHEFARRVQRARIRTGGGSSGPASSQLVLAIDGSFRFRGLRDSPPAGRGGAPIRSAASLIHCSARLSASGLMRQVRTRPDFAERTRPDASSTARCCITAGSDIVERPRQFADRNRLARQPLDDRSPRRIGEGLKSAVERPRLVKHML